MIPKDINIVAQSDLQELIDNAVLESKTIEYKLELPGNSDNEKKEFLADVSSFANASGGDIIFGILEDRASGVPCEIKGLDGINADEEVRRIESIIRDGIEPRIPSVSTKVIILENQKPVLILRIQKSWISPHRVVYKGWDKFFSRSSNGKYALDVTELRDAFLYSETIIDRMKRFREERISAIFANEAPINFIDGPKAILHLIPINAFTGKTDGYELNINEARGIYPLGSYSYHYRYNFDGILLYAGNDRNVADSYLQIYRNGILETVDESMFTSANDDIGIPSLYFEDEIIKVVKKYLEYMKKKSIGCPVFLFLTLLGFKGICMYVDSQRTYSKGYAIDRDILMAPEVIIENYDIEVEKILKLPFESVWNACGFPKSHYYNESGEWIGREV